MYMRNSSKNESTCPCICVAVGTAVVSIDEMWSSTALSHTATTTASRLRRLPILVRNRRPDLKTCLPCRAPQAPCPNSRPPLHAPTRSALERTDIAILASLVRRTRPPRRALQVPCLNSQMSLHAPLRSALERTGIAASTTLRALHTPVPLYTNDDETGTGATPPSHTVVDVSRTDRLAKFYSEHLNVCRMLSSTWYV
jgi:hypothetical protein